jgi:hypothetical protein
MFKPKVLGTNFTLGNNFAEQEVQVSISVDEFDFTDNSPYRVFVQLEPPDIVPTEQKLIDNHTFYNLILTWNQRVLEGCPNNSVKYLFGTCRWATQPVDACDVSQKKFSVSYLTSSKTMCKGHYFRHEIYNNLPSAVGDLNVTKHMSPPVLECKRPLLYPFQYSIVMENGKRTNWITEKLIDCLVSRTIPIYWGAPNVGEYFDTDGILTFDTYSDLSIVLRSLTPEFYQSRLKAIEHNLHEAMKYTDVHARINEEIRRRLRYDHLRTPLDQRPRQEVCQRLSRFK